jgi:hypothetical protein
MLGKSIYMCTKDVYGHVEAGKVFRFLKKRAHVHSPNILLQKYISKIRLTFVLEWDQIERAFC